MTTWRLLLVKPKSIRGELGVNPKSARGKSGAMSVSIRAQPRLGLGSTRGGSWVNQGPIRSHSGLDQGSILGQSGGDPGTIQGRSGANPKPSRGRPGSIRNEAGLRPGSRQSLNPKSTRVHSSVRSRCRADSMSIRVRPGVNLGGDPKSPPSRIREAIRLGCLAPLGAATRPDRPGPGTGQPSGNRKQGRPVGYRNTDLGGGSVPRLRGRSGAPDAPRPGHARGRSSSGGKSSLSSPDVSPLSQASAAVAGRLRRRPSPGPSPAPPSPASGRMPSAPSSPPAELEPGLRRAGPWCGGAVLRRAGHRGDAGEPSKRSLLPHCCDAGLALVLHGCRAGTALVCAGRTRLLHSYYSGAALIYHWSVLVLQCWSTGATMALP